MTEQDRPGPRKRLRVGQVSERGAINAVRTLLERSGLVVHEVADRSDYGRDLMVDLTEDGEITGTVVGVQVKGDKRFVRAGDWLLPSTPKDRRYWADSSVPVIGIVWDPGTGRMRWTNLTEFARRPPEGAPDRTATVNVPVREPLTDESLPPLVAHAQDYVRRASPNGLLDLYAADEESRVLAVYDCWALGRADARAFLMLRRAIPDLDGESLTVAIWLLSHLTPHPDIAWHEGNWVPPAVKDRVKLSFRWSAAEVYHLVAGVEALVRSGGASGWERGGLGQCLWHLLAEDTSLRAAARSAIGLAVGRHELDTAVRLVIIAQWGAGDPLAEMEAAAVRHPALTGHELWPELMEQAETYGYLPVY